MQLPIREVKTAVSQFKQQNAVLLKGVYKLELNYELAVLVMHSFHVRPAVSSRPGAEQQYFPDNISSLHRPTALATVSKVKSSILS